MKKLALCFSGDLRTYDRCFDSIKSNLLDKFDCDVFISSYRVSDEVTNNVIELYKPKKFIFRIREVVNDTVSKYVDDLESIKMIRNGVDNLSFENVGNLNTLEDCFFNYERYENSFFYHKLSVDALCQFFGIMDVATLCNQYMVENNLNYDYILRIRFDNMIYNTFKIFDLEENEMLVNTFHYYSDSIKFNDHFFMAKPNTFFKISSLYKNIPNIIQIINKEKCWLPTSGYPETLLLINVLLQNIKIKECSSEFCCIKLDYTFEDVKWKILGFK